LRDYSTRADSHVTIWVTSRIAGYADCPLWSEKTPGDAPFTGKELALLPFETKERDKFIAAFFQSSSKPERGLEMIRELRARPVQRLSNSPLMLTFLCLLFREGQLTPRVPLRRVDIYREIIEGAFLGEWEQHRKDEESENEGLLKEEIEHSMECLRRVAAMVYPQEQIRGKIENLAEVKRWWRSLARSNDLKKLVGKKGLTEHFLRVGILVEETGGNYAFFHRTVLEYCAAGWFAGLAEREHAPPPGTKRKSSHSTESKGRAVDTMGRWAWDPQRREVVLLFTGQLASANIIRGFIERLKTPAADLDNPERNDVFILGDF
jgi:hypothetical protein